MQRSLRRLAAVALLCGLGASFACAQKAQAHSTLQKIRAAHELACGVVQEDAEYSTEDDHSSRGGFDTALCEAYAAAVDTRIVVKVARFLDEASALDALRAGAVDVIASVSADGAHRVYLGPGVRLTRPVFYDSLALLAPVASGVKRPRDLSGKKICLLAETGTEDALRAWFARHRIDYLPFPFQEEGEMEAAYISNNCAALAGERTRLSLIRLSLGEAAADHRVLPEPLSKDSMASASPASDPVWARVVDAVAGVLLLAEQMRITAEDLGLPSSRSRANTALFLKRTGQLGTRLGLRPGWAPDVLRNTGNYAQMYERTLGADSARELPREMNRLRGKGGLLVPVRAR